MRRLVPLKEDAALEFNIRNAFKRNISHKKVTIWPELFFFALPNQKAWIKKFRYKKTCL